MADFEMAWTDLDKPSKIFEHARGSHEHGHPTQKPYDLMRWCLEHALGDLILDPFMGSGTTLMAAEGLGRKCFGLELDPSYCDVTVNRWQQHSGREAIHADTDNTYATIEASRSKPARKRKRNAETV